MSRSGAVAAFDGHVVHLFDPARGTHRVIGQRGAGPNEFMNLISGCFTRGDTLFAFDFALRRVSVLAPGGEIVRQFGVSTYLPMWGSACSTDGTIALQESGAIVDGERQGKLVRVNTAGAVLGSLGSFPSGVGPLRTQIVGIGASTLVGDPRTRVIGQYDSNGIVSREIVMGDPLDPMAADDVAYLGLSPRQGASARARSGGSPPPTHWPLFGSLVTDVGGRIWIEQFRRESDEDSDWLVLDGEASDVFVVRIPRSLSSAPHPILVSADSNGVVLLRRDSDGAAQISRHRLTAVFPTNR